MLGARQLLLPETAEIPTSKSELCAPRGGNLCAVGCEGLSQDPRLLQPAWVLCPVCRRLLVCALPKQTKKVRNKISL